MTLTPTEKQIAALWVALGGARPGSPDEIFSGDPAPLAAELQRRFGVAIAPGLTLAAQAAIADARHQGVRFERISGERFPLSAPQLRLWLFEQWMPGTNANLVQRVWRLHHAPDVERALQLLIAREEGLRTTFGAGDGVPFQRVGSSSCSFRVAPAMSAEELCRSERAQPIDLGNGPLWRVVRSGQLLCLTTHHIVCDAGAFYAFIAGLLDLDSPPRAFGPTDFAVWQRRRLDAGELDAALDFWRRRLQGAPAGGDLPLDQPRRTRGFEAASVALELPPAFDQLRRLARARGASTFTLLLAIFALWLRRITRQEDLMVGVPLSGRVRPELRDAIGLFSDTLPLRLDLDGDPSFEQLLDRVRDRLREATANEAPLQPILAGGRNSLAPFDVMLNLHPPQPPLAGVTAVDTGYRPLFVDLDWELRDVEGRLHSRLYYAPELFHAESAARFSAQLCRLIESAAADPTRRLSRLSMLGPGERQRVLVEPNRTGEPLSELRLHQLFEAQAARTPNAVALEEAGASLRFGELERRANQVAHALIAQGVKSGDRVVISLPRSIDLVTAELAALKAGAAFVPLDPAQRSDEIVRDAAPRIIITRDWLRALPQLPESAPPVSGGDAAYLIYTSGSTGAPKGVVVSHHGAVNQVRWMNRRFAASPDDVACLKTPIGFVDTIYETFGPLAAGARNVIVDDDDPRLLGDALLRHGVTRLLLVPSLLRTLLSLFEGEFFPRLRWWLVGGDELSPELCAALLARRPDARLFNLYGCAEASADTTCWEVREVPRCRVPIGNPIANARVAVVEPGGQPAPIGVPGELWIGGAGVAAYLGRPDLERERFVDSPFPEWPPGRVYRTGDLARRAASGELEYLGRERHLKVRGVRFEPSEIEAVLARHPAVAEAAVTICPGADGEAALAAWLVWRAAPDDGVAAFARRELPPPLVPSRWGNLPHLPRLPSGKIDRRALPPLPEPSTSSPPPGSDAERLIAAAWRELLALESLGIDDDFFSLGGHSLLAAQLAARLEAATGLEVPLGAIFEATTIRAQAAWLQQRRPSLALPPAPRGPRMPLSFAQERMWLLSQLGAGHYQVHRSVRLRGPLDRRWLREAVARVAERHEALRTRIGVERGVPYQEVLARVEPDFAEDELATDQIEKAAAAEALRPFDLERAPLARTRLWRLGPDDHLLGVSFHHLVSDGTSVDLWLAEVAEHYDAALQKRAPRLAPLPVQPADVAWWQRRWLAEGRLDRQRRYWREQLEGAVGGLPLPSEPSAQTGVGRVGRAVPPELLESLRRRARAARCTLFTTLLAALDLVLHRLTGETDLIVGAVVGVRSRAELEPLLGLFVDALPLRVRLDGDPGPREVLRRVQAITSRALAHCEVPITQMVADAAPRRRAGRNPLYDVMLNHFRPRPLPQLSGIEVTAAARFQAMLEQTELDLMVRAVERPAALSLDLEFQRARFSTVRMESLLARYLEVLQAIAG